ncbi:hypothetical protein SEA_VANLEE_154 [Gordonia phage VanLee]|uniref:Uncharacterized protein n=1 Tax=Gordonia phage VanLee TaxID=2845816 RepID=A0A8F2DAB1_9CAUD|nr:hypothetical protein QEH49_gp136 [Gordonia phage VanLee]QWS68270.1 hypothetical protein SEA_VANLEE_154 [Gordonia phage VanLee]
MSISTGIMTEALVAEVYRAAEDGRITEADVEHYVDNAPESHVFVAGECDDWDAETVGAVTTADAHRKVTYWRNVVDALPGRAA